MGDCQTIVRILNSYALASGQVINFSKSLITFSPNVVGEVWGKICRELGLVNSSQVQNSYLGLPSIVGHNKRSVFNVVKERVVKHLQIWKSKIFSNGGHEILIKAVAQATATYTMSVFRVPASLCQEIQSLVA